MKIPALTQMGYDNLQVRTVKQKCRVQWDDLT